MKKRETNQIMQENEYNLKNINKIIVNSGLHRPDEDMITEDISVSDTCCMCLKKMSDALVVKIVIFCGYGKKNDKMDNLFTFCFKTKNAIKGKKYQSGNTGRKSEK